MCSGESSVSHLDYNLKIYFNAQNSLGLNYVYKYYVRFTTFLILEYSLCLNRDL